MPAIIGLAISLLIDLLRKYLPGIVGRILLTLGFTFVTQTVAMPSLLAMIQTRVSGMPSVMLAYFGALRLDVCISLILSAMAANKAQQLIFSKRP